jgi:hypothetical protein
MAKKLLSDEDIKNILYTPEPTLPQAEQVIPNAGQRIIEELGKEVSEVTAMLAELLDYNQVRLIGGYKRGRCRSCDVPHLFWKVCPCPHHKALELLKRLGVTVQAT